MNILDNGRYRLKKDWNSCSIPSLVDIDEHEDMNATIPAPQKPPRRSSIAIGLLAGKPDKSTKRRSSIAVSFLGRRDSHKITKDTNSSYENAMKTEKSDGSPKSPDIIFTSDENFHASSPKEGRVVYFEDGDDTESSMSKSLNAYESPVDKERNRRRRSSIQTKLDRRRRKNADPNQLSPETSIHMEDDMNDEEQAAFEMEASQYMQRQKRHSWWNIFVPDQLKQRSTRILLKTQQGKRKFLSRRASQDVTLMSRSVDNLAIAARRSKSRSVDHGLAAPFDLDSLRSKVEGRFESVDRSKYNS